MEIPFRFCPNLARAPRGGKYAVWPVRSHAGQIAVGKSRRGRFRSIRGEGTVLLEEAHEPLVSKLLYKKVQVALAKRRVEPNALTPGRCLLKGLLVLHDGRRLQGFTMSQSIRTSL